MDDLTADTDPYALDFPVCKDASASAGRDERLALMRKLEQAKHQDERKNLQGYQGTLLTSTKTCLLVQKYLLTSTRVQILTQLSCRIFPALQAVHRQLHARVFEYEASPGHFSPPTYLFSNERNAAFNYGPLCFE